MNYVYDASAVLALLRNEPGAEVVETLLANHGGMITPVNALEVLRRLRRSGHDPATCERALEVVPIHIPPLTGAMALRAARIEDAEGVRPLSLADRMCIGAALELDATIVTADRAWAELDLPVAVSLVR